MEGFPRIGRTMSAGPGPLSFPAPHPPRRGHSVTAGRMMRCRSVWNVREHKSVLDFGRDWRDCDVDIFQDDEMASNATTDAGTTTSIGICIGIAGNEEAIADEAQPPQTSEEQPISAAPATNRPSTSLPSSFASAPQTPSAAARLMSQCHWHDLLAATGSGENNNSIDNDKFAFDRGCPINRGNGPGAGCGVSGAGTGIPARPNSSAWFSYPNRRRPKTASNGVGSPLHGASPSPTRFTSSPSTSASPSPTGASANPPYALAAAGSPSPRPLSESGSNLSLARSSSGSRPLAPRVSFTQTPSCVLGSSPFLPSAGSALLQQAAGTSAADAAATKVNLSASGALALTPAPAPGTAPLEPPPPIPPRPLGRPLPSPHLRHRSHNPVLLSSHSSYADLKLSPRTDHVRSQIITKLTLQPVPEEKHIRTAQWDHHLAQEDEQRRRQCQQQRQQAEEDEDCCRREEEEEDAARWAEEVTCLEKETDRILAELKAKDLARLRAQLDAIPDAPPRVRSPIVDSFPFFLSKGRKFDPATLTKTPSANLQSLTQDCRPVSEVDPSRFIQPGGGSIVPQTDAPASASNLGERRVTIRCLQSSISLPVTPDTAPSDILYSAINLMTHNIDPRTSVVHECYSSYGLGRRLRRYERVRNVMNSWDHDTQHYLLIVPDDPADKHLDLNLEGVPRTIDPPRGLVNIVLYHCNQPGKWNKRYITIMESGQVFSAKKKNAKLSDKDAISLCHLSDFDIYAVTEKVMLDNIKPPKKNCTAVKSQQKMSVFQNTENFIHFFATDDSKLADNFQRVIHGWRSWFLVNKVDLIKKPKDSLFPPGIVQ